MKKLTNVLSRSTLQICATVFVFTLFTFFVPTTHAQWFGDGVQRREEKVPILGLSSVPELHTDMPLDCMIGYIAMDSLAKSENIQTVLAMPQNSTMATLRGLAHLMYSMMDYDPVLLTRHIVSVNDSTVPSNTYRSFLANTYYGAQKAILKRLDEFGANYGMLLTSYYILKVRVTEVRIGIDTTFTPRDWVNVSCEVEEIFKGQYLPHTCIEPVKQKGKNNRIANSTCFKFGFPKDESTGGGYNHQKGQGGGKAITLIRTPLINEEFYVFLKQYAISQYEDFILPEYAYESMGGLFRIVDGNVEDNGNFWGLGKLPAENDFRTNLLQKIYDIKHWSLF